MRIILVILAPVAGGGLFFLLLGLIFLLMFSMDGDRVPNSINSIISDTMCYPSISHYEKAIAEGNYRSSKGEKYSEKAVNEIMDKFGIVWLKKESKVKVHRENIGYYGTGQLSAVFYRVTPINDPKRSCLVRGGFLEMEFFDWIQWRWDKYKNNNK